MNQRQHPGAPRVRLFAAISLGVISIAGSVLLVVTDAIGGNVRWAHHSGASAAPLLLVAGAITAVSIAYPPNGRHGLMRLVAVLAFIAWGIAQLAPDRAVAGALNDAAILLFVTDAACVVVPDARALLAGRRRPVPATQPARFPAKTDGTVLPADLESALSGAAAPPCCAKTEPAVRFALRRPRAFDVGAGSRGRGHAGDHDPPQLVVGRAVAAGVQPVPDGLA